MDQRTIQILFSLLRSAIRGTKLTDAERIDCTPELLQKLLEISLKHDVSHLLVLGMKQNDLITGQNIDVKKYILKAVYRYERLNGVYENICDALEKAEIPFMPLKGAIIRKYYPEPWMRTSCDIDILVHREDLENAVSYLTKTLGYTEKYRATHDVSVYSPEGVNVELHFDLVEEERANNAIDILNCVWNNVLLRNDKKYWYEMTDAFFYYYHIVHMAKHFETGGCGIRPFIDLWILDQMNNVDTSVRDALLSQGNLLKFAQVSRKLSQTWFDGLQQDDITCKMQNYIIYGGVYGSADNRVALQQSKKGGRIGYILSRIFIPYSKLKRYYPVLDNHPWLMPFMQIRRWFMLLNPAVAKMAKREITVNSTIEKTKANEMKTFLDNIGLD